MFYQQSINLPLPTEEVLASLAYGEAGAAITEQSWVDAYYASVSICFFFLFPNSILTLFAVIHSSLDDIGGPYPDGDVDLRKYYGNVASWYAP